MIASLPAECRYPVNVTRALGDAKDAYVRRSIYSGYVAARESAVIDELENEYLRLQQQIDQASAEAKRE